MHHPTPSNRSLSRQLTVAVILFTMAALAAIAGFASWSVARVDERSLNKQQNAVSFALTEQFENLPVEQTSATVWDDAVLRAKAHDSSWLSENLTVWMETYFGHDRNYVLDEKDRLVQAAADGHLVDDAAFTEDWPTIAPLVADLRAQIKVASDGQADPTEVISVLGSEDLLLLNGQPAIISVKPIVPSTDAITQVPGSEYLQVAVQYIDQVVVNNIAKEFSLAGAHVATSKEDGFWTASVPLLGKALRIIGYVAWTRDRPGVTLIQEVAPALAVGVFCGLFLIWFMLRRLRHSSVQLQASEAQAQFLAFHDTLTGLPNRALFEDRLERALAQGRRGHQKVSLLYLDLDRFKNVNDTLGHPAGDELVRQAATRLAGCIRDVDTVARLGGDEFAIIQADVRDEQEAERLAERIAAEFARPFDLLGDQSFVSVSIGITLSYGDSSNKDEMLRKADIALYEAKGQGRARYQVFAGDMDDLVRRRRSIERDLRLALAAGEITVAYQPLYADNGKRIVGAEALARWQHPVHGAMSPELFIGIAEERGLIEQLGEQVLRTACSFALKTNLPWVAVNVSPVQFRNERIVDRVMQILLETGLPPQRLQLEITEGVLLENGGVADRLIADFRENGIRIALDDFGTGYSSMSYLRRYGVDKLKIDRSFIQELGQTSDAAAIVRAMVTLARALHMQVTAEGVETVEQRDHLTAIGCHELQGFLLSRPLSAEQFVAMLKPGELRLSGARAY